MIEAAQRNNVKLEVAENYYRAPRERFLSTVIDAGVIGEVGRIYRIFYEGGYHGMSMLRLRANGEPKVNPRYRSVYPGHSNHRSHETQPHKR